MEPYKIILVDDHSLFRNGLRGLLERCAACRVVGEAASGEEFLAMLGGVDADVVFMDFAMPGLDGAQTTERALAQRPDLKIITLSMFGEESYYSRMVQAGARGFLLKDSDIGDVIEAVETVAAGGSYFSPQLLSSLTGRMRTREDAADEQLSSREREILVAVCRGLSVARYWARRKSTFPLGGPWTDAMKRPLSENQETVTPSAAQCSRRYGLQLTRPKQAMDWSVCRGMVPRLCPSWCSSTHSPCLESQVSCVVTNKVFR